MKIIIQNLTAEHLVIEVEPQSGETIRELLSPQDDPRGGDNVDVGPNIDPYTLQNDQSIIDLITAGKISVTLFADPWDVATATGVGGVTGPAGATDNAIVRFDGGSGGNIQNSAVTIDDLGNISTTGTVDSRDVSADGAALDTHIADTGNPHATSIANLGAGTLAQLNAVVSDATLDDSSASRPPTGAASGQLGGTYPSPDVRGIRETGGPTLLTIGSIPDGRALQRSGSTIVGVIAGTGDVVGPAGATDNAIARYDLATGKLLQDSLATVDDAGNIATPGTVDGRDISADWTTISGHIAATNNPHATQLEDLGSGTLAQLNAIISDATLDDSSASRPPSGAAGGDLEGTYPNPSIYRITTEVRNESGSPIPAFRLLYASGMSGGITLVDLADKDDPGKRPAFAVSLASIPNNTTTRVLRSGKITGVDTSSFSITDQLVLGNSGNFSRPPPDADPFTGEVQSVGQVAQAAVSGEISIDFDGLQPVTADQIFSLINNMPRGKLTGGACTRNSGLDVDVAAGEGYVFDGGTYQRVLWSADTVTVPASSVFYIWVDSSGVVQTSVSEPSHIANVLVGGGRSSATDVIVLTEHFAASANMNLRFHEYVSDVIGPIWVSGLSATINGGDALRIDVDSGSFYVFDVLKTLTGAAPATMTSWRTDGLGGQIFASGVTQIDTANYDNAGSLDPIPANKWIKHLFVATELEGAGEHHFVYGQEVFNTQEEAEAGNNPLLPEGLSEFGLRIAGVVVQQGAVAITSLVDERPTIGQRSTGSTAPPSVHSSLGGLGVGDDHPQYQLRSEKDIASGYAGLDGSGAISGTAHGTQAGGALHSVATVATAGFMSSSDKSKLVGLPSSAPPTTRNLTAGAGLTGGGDLSADRTFDVVANVDGSIVVNANDVQVGVLASDAQHGNRGGGTQHAVATTSVNGFMSSTDKTKLDGISSGSGVPTKQEFFSVEPNATVGNRRTRSIPTNGSWQFTFDVPHDFVSVTSLHILGFATGGGAPGVGRDIDLFSEYGNLTLGEARNVHSTSETTNTYTIPALNIGFVLDITPVFPSLAAGDNCGVTVTHNSIGGSVDYQVVVLRYT